MIVTVPSFRVLRPFSDDDWQEELRRVEAAGRTCYKSEAKMGLTTYEDFIRNRVKAGHESILEHGIMSVRFICDRGVSHELVRHRLATFSQESTRYCAYDTGLTFIKPVFWKKNDPIYQVWEGACIIAEQKYQLLRGNGASPEEARSVLPISLKTELVMTANLREWRHVLRLRTTRAAHPQMRQIMVPLLAMVKEVASCVFGDIQAGAA